MTFQEKLRKLADSYRKEGTPSPTRVFWVPTRLTHGS